MNKKAVALISSIMCSGFILTGCSDVDTDNTQSNLEATDESNEEMSEKEKKKALEKRQKLEKKYVDLIEEDYSNQYEIAQKFMKDEYGIDCEFDKENGKLETGQHLSTHTLEMISLDEHKTRFEVRFSRMYENIDSDYKTSRIYDIIMPKIKEHYKDVLPDGFEIHLRVSTDDEDFNVNFDELKNMSYEEILSHEEFRLVGTVIMINNPKESDYNNYKDAIKIVANDICKSNGDDYLDEVYVVFSKEDNFLDDYLGIFGNRFSKYERGFTNLEVIQRDKQYYEKDFLSKLEPVTHYIELNKDRESYERFLEYEFNEMNLNESIKELKLD